MRLSVLLAAVFLAACATEKLASSPPAGVDLSGHWLLDEVDSDDPMRLMQTQLAMATANAGPGGTSGSGGQRGQQSGRAAPAAGYMGPPMPSVTVLDDALRWPGKSLVITQGDGIVTFASGGRRDLCRPDFASAPPKHDPSAQGAPSRDQQTHGRGDVPAPVCGWDGQALVVHSGDPENDPAPFERRFRLSDGGEQLIELVAFTGGRSSGFTASRVWSRVPPAPVPGASASRPQP